jgi:hypothetical protein
MESPEENADMDEFERFYSIGHIMSAMYAVPIDTSKQKYINDFEFHPRYQLRQNDPTSTVTINVDHHKGLVTIYLPNKIVLDRPFDLYKILMCKDDKNVAARWRHDARLQDARMREEHPTSSQINYAPAAESMGTQAQPSICATTYPSIQANQNSITAITDLEYLSWPLPKIDINSILDRRKLKLAIDLQLCIGGPKFFAWDLAHEISKKTDVPFTSIMMIILGVFSGYTCKFWNCAYQFNGTSPISLYVCVEHPSGTKKTRILKTLLSPFMRLFQPKIHTLGKTITSNDHNIDSLKEQLAGSVDKYEKAELKSKIQAIKNNSKKLKSQLNILKGLTPVTNATPEALEKVLCQTNGHFFAASSEKGLINSLMGLTYGKKHYNHDMLLNGRDGGEVNVERIGRESYYGPITGSIVEFAQEGTILSIVSRSENIGLAERFSFVSEPNNIGKRDHTKNHTFDDSILDRYNKRAQFLKKLVEIEDLNIYSAELDHKNQISLTISEKYWEAIYHFENELEQKLTENGELSNPLFQGMASKVRMQIMSFACNLYLLDLDTPPKTQADPLTLVPDEYVATAIQMVRSLIDHNRDFLETYGVVNNNEQIAVAYEYFLDRKDKWFSMLQLKKSLAQVKPFKFLVEPRLGVENAILWLADNNIILKNLDATEFRFNPRKFSLI